MKLKNPKRWYWLTLRFVSKIPRVFRFVRSGVRATVVTTTRCNLHCSYCPMFMHGPVKEYQESTFEEWKTWFERFPVWISQVYVSGGEPSDYPHIVPLVNYLIDRGHHVIVFTNLWKIENYNGIRPHWRLIFQPTFHKGQDNLERFEAAVAEMRKKYQVTSQQVRVNPFGMDRIKEFFTRKWFTETDDGFQFAPDTPRSLQVWSGCVNLYRSDGEYTKAE